MILRIIDKQTKLFIRDDFTFNAETEIGLNVEPAQGFIAPKWNEYTVSINDEETGLMHENKLGEWVEGA